MEQEKKKSKAKIIILIVVIVVIAIVGIVIIRNTNSNTNSNDAQNISQEDLTQIDINTENWKDYIVLTDKEDNFYDDFGELAYTSKYTEIALKDTIYSGSMILKFTPLERNIHSSEIIITVDKDNAYTTDNKTAFINSDTSISKYIDCSITINDLKCINAKGTIYMYADT